MDNLKAVFFALLSAFIWGSAPVLFKLGLRGDVPPLVGIFIHNLTATLFALLGVLILRENPFAYPLKQILTIALGGFVSGFLGLLVYYKALKFGQVSVVAPIASTSPLFSSLLAVLVLGESFSLMKLTGTLLIIAGVVILTTSR
ncbi:MAG: EamA family transporter [Aquificae bacterium]|nr:EamA family transporter [Aquificota bacterium]